MYVRHINQLFFPATNWQYVVLHSFNLFHYGYTTSTCTWSLYLVVKWFHILMMSYSKCHSQGRPEIQWTHPPPSPPQRCCSSPQRTLFLPHLRLSRSLWVSSGRPLPLTPPDAQHTPLLGYPRQRSRSHSTGGHYQLWWTTGHQWCLR